MPFKNIEDKRRYQREWKQNRRRTWIESQGGACVVCGIEEDLQIDHIDARTKTHEIGSIWSRSIYVRHKELQKCQILCGTCHFEKTCREERELRHFRQTKKSPYTSLFLFDNNPYCDCRDCARQEQLRLEI